MGAAIPPRDVTREVRTEPTQDVSRASSSDDIGDDVVMRGDNADENIAEHPGSSGSDSRRRTTTRGNHVKSEMRKRASPSNTSQEESRRKRRRRSTQLQSPHKRHWTDTA